jgi:hypothetical protein
MRRWDRHGRCSQAPRWENGNEIAVSLDELARDGARRMIAAALEAEVEYVERFADERGEGGKRLVARNGRARERRVTVGSGTVADAARLSPSTISRLSKDLGAQERVAARTLALGLRGSVD